jgi:hypothetical protein
VLRDPVLVGREQRHREDVRLLSSRLSAVCRLTDMPTSGGSSDSETSDPTVIP